MILSQFNFFGGGSVGSAAKILEWKLAKIQIAPIVKSARPPAQSYIRNKARGEGQMLSMTVRSPAVQYPLETQP